MHVVEGASDRTGSAKADFAAWLEQTRVTALPEFRLSLP